MAHDTVSIIDFFGNIRGDDGFIIVYNGGYSVEYDNEFKAVYFWGLLWGIPIMYVSSQPTEDEVWDYIITFLKEEINMTLSQWYKHSYEELYKHENDEE